MATRYAVRERTLPAHLAAARTSLTVWDVTEAHTRRPVAYGVHTARGRAYMHAEQLNTRAATEAYVDQVLDAFARIDDRARIADRIRREAEER